MTEIVDENLFGALGILLPSSVNFSNQPVQMSNIYRNLCTVVSSRCPISSHVAQFLVKRRSATEQTTMKQIFDVRPRGHVVISNTDFIYQIFEEKQPKSSNSK